MVWYIMSFFALQKGRIAVPPAGVIAVRRIIRSASTVLLLFIPQESSEDGIVVR